MGGNNSGSAIKVADASVAVAFAAAAAAAGGGGGGNSSAGGDGGLSRWQKVSL